MADVKKLGDNTYAQLDRLLQETAKEWVDDAEWLADGDKKIASYAASIVQQGLIYFVAFAIAQEVDRRTIRLMGSKHHLPEKDA